MHACVEHLAKVEEYLAPDTLDCAHTSVLKRLWTPSYEAAFSTNVMQVPEEDEEESGAVLPEEVCPTTCLSIKPSSCVCFQLHSKTPEDKGLVCELATSKSSTYYAVYGHDADFMGVSTVKMAFSEKECVADAEMVAANG
jgi:hypothetical protein